MRTDINNSNRRILVIDDNPAIHEDFRKILGAALPSAAALFGDPTDPFARAEFQMDSALQGQEGVALVHRAREANQPYAMAFVDARMPPGWDGIETAARIWEQDPDVHIVICTAYSDYSWHELRQKLVYADRLVILKKPFDSIEVLQLADALTHRWEVLGRHGCEMAQGFYFCRPLPADQCRRLLLDLGQRSCFTDTLRMWASSPSPPGGPGG